MIPIEEQIDAILNAKTWDLAAKYCGGNHERLLSLLTATRSDLKRYIAEHGFPEGWWRFEPATFDGLYTVEQGGRWSAYLQERGARCWQAPETFATQEEAADYVLDNFYLKAI